MKRKRQSNWNMPKGELREIKDFLPPPHELAKARRVVRVTMDLDYESVEFFKKQAEKHKTKYQKMIREVLSKYTSEYNKAA